MSLLSRLSPRWAALAVIGALAAGCGSVGPRSGDAAVDQPRDAPADQGAADHRAADQGTADQGADHALAEDGGVDAPSADAPPSDASSADADLPDDAGACAAGVACATNPGAPCLLGRTVCTGGVATCVDGPWAAEGTLCTGGACAGGTCLPPTTIGDNVNLATMSLTPGRACADAPQFTVAGLTASTATLAATPADGCLAAGDEVLLISLQGAPNATVNVGNWELLTIASAAGTTVTFAGSKTRFYGAAAGSDVGVGGGTTDQKVALVRLPRFGPLTVAAGATLTAAPWNGATGGVVALRAASLIVNGTISASALGYRSGRWSQDGPCNTNLTTEAGESITGPGSASTMRNAGGAGGIAAASAITFNSNTPIGATAGHAMPGAPGANANGRTLGQPGEAYGTGDGTRLTMGSAPGGNLTCNGVGGSPRYVPSGIVAGGIVMIVTGDMTVSSTGSITATPPNADRDEAASGGYVFIRARNLALGNALVNARGAVARGGSPSTQGMSVNASPGYIVLQAQGTVTGTTDPVASIVPGP